MTYRGRVEEGRIILDPPVDLPEGAVVDVQVREPAPEPAPADGTFYERFKPFIGQATDLPADVAVNHDHYLYGVPKQRP